MSTSIIAKCPGCNNEFLYKGHAKRPRPTCSKCKLKFYLSTQNNHVSTPSTPRKKRTIGEVDSSPPSIPPKNTPQEPRFIDDPDELLLSVAVRELNKLNPDSRWASILIACKKEKITNKTDVMDQFKQLPTKALISLLKKNSLEELS